MNKNDNHTFLKAIQHTINQCIDGDAAAQRKLYSEHKIGWYMTSMRYGKNKMQAEDIMQEGMIEIFNSLKQYDERKAAFKTWSNRVVVYAALKYLKKNSWANAMTGIDDLLQVADKEALIYDHLSAKELTLLIQRLPIGYRVVFNMYVIEGYTHKEIAKELGIKDGTSKSQLSKARRTLRNYLENQLTNTAGA